MRENVPGKGHTDCYRVVIETQKLQLPSCKIKGTRLRPRLAAKDGEQETERNFT